MDALLRKSGIHLPSDRLEQLWTYHQLLRQHNPELNLTRIHNFTNMVLKLYVDSILPGRLIDLPSPLLDLGTGPGMPGIPLKIAYPQLTLLLAESRQKRVAFLKTVVEKLNFPDVEVVGEGITPHFERPVAGVITRAVEDMAATIDRVRGCLMKDGLVIFMKGPHCDEEIQAASERFMKEYRLSKDQSYNIPNTSHERRLVVFQRLGEPLFVKKAKAMERYISRIIESEQNPLFKDLKKLLGSRGIRKQKKALVAGSKQVSEVLSQFPELCEAWIGSREKDPPPPDSPEHLNWYQLSSPLFQSLDVFGTGKPLLLIRIKTVEKWAPDDGLPEGCTVFIPFQDPENVGSVIRSAAAFGADQVILLSESAHPYHPKALRASGGTVLGIRILEGPSLAELPEDLPLLPLSAGGRDIAEIAFPDTFAFLPGIEGPGLPEQFKKNAVSIPIDSRVESLNAATATAIALYAWSQYRRKHSGV